MAGDSAGQRFLYARPDDCKLEKSEEWATGMSGRKKYTNPKSTREDFPSAAIQGNDSQLFLPWSPPQVRVSESSPVKP